MKIKCITLKQPFAHLIVTGHKEFETRNWQTNYRGDLYIHAGQQFYFSDYNVCQQDPFFKAALPDLSKLQTGAIIGKVKLVNCARVEEIKHMLTEKELKFGNYWPGYYGWELEEPQMIEPIPMLGKLSIWEADIPEQLIKLR